MCDRSDNIYSGGEDLLEDWYIIPSVLFRLVQGP